MPLIEQGRINAWFLEVVRANVREPIQVEGDIYALIACNEIGCRRLVGMMDEYGLDSLDELGAFIVDASRRGMQAEIAKLQKGTWRADRKSTRLNSSH